MGVMALSDFREELAARVGGRADVTSPRMNRWINFGYLDVTGSVEFEELEEEQDIQLAADEYEEAIPATVRSIVGIRDADGLLQWIPKHEWQRIFGGEGNPIKWTRIGGFMKFTPVPQATWDGVALFKIEPGILSADESVTAIPQTWDLAVHYMAVSHALFAIEEEAEGTIWFNRAVAYMKTRAHEERRNMLEPALGGTIAARAERIAGAMGGNLNAYQGGG